MIITHIAQQMSNTIQTNEQYRTITDHSIWNHNNYMRPFLTIIFRDKLLQNVYIEYMQYNFISALKVFLYGIRMLI